MNRNETLAKIEVETKTNTNININNKDKLEGNSLKNKESQNPKEKKNDEGSGIFYLSIKDIKKRIISKSLKFSNSYDNLPPTSVGPYNNLSSRNKKVFKHQNGDILNISPIFSSILTKENFSKDSNATRKNLIKFIIENNYRKKAVINTTNSIFIFILEIISLYFFTVEYSCKNANIESKDSNYWECPLYGKCKVEKRWFHMSNIIKIVYYLIFYVFYFIYKIIFLWKFECKFVRKCQTKTLIIIYKILEYSLLLAIILLDFYDDSKCECRLVDGKKIFIKINNYILNLGASIIDLFIKLTNNE